MKTPDNNAASAEKRALWEVRQRYAVGGDNNSRAAKKPLKPAAPEKTTPTPPAPPPTSSPPVLRKSKKRGGAGKMFLRLFLLIIVILLMSGGVFGYKILAASNKISTTKRSVLGQLTDLLFAQGKKLNGEQDDRINILLMAIGGEGHDGANLTDTIMVASLRPSDNSVALLSIPRDLYVQIPHEQYYTKINAIHAYAEAQQAGSGPKALEEKISEITGLRIDYYARVDFQAFKQIIDAVGGVNITIEKSFFDYWHKIAFSAGTETMNGDRALAYVRARYVEGSEGGDFKRAARQQQTLLAIREKVFSVNTALDFNALNKILDSLSNNIRTDMSLWEMKRFYEIARQVDRSKVISVVLNNGPQGVLVSGTEVMNGVPAYVLKPKSGNYSEIQAIASNIFSSGQHMAASSDQAGGDNSTPPPDAANGSAIPLNTKSPNDSNSPTPSVSPIPETAKPVIEIRNGTTIIGLAKTISDKLAAQKYKISTIGNAIDRTNTTTAIYTLTVAGQNGAHEVTNIVKGTVSSAMPSGEKDSKADILIILGADAK